MPGIWRDAIAQNSSNEETSIRTSTRLSSLRTMDVRVYLASRKTLRDRNNEIQTVILLHGSPCNFPQLTPAFNGLQVATGETRASPARA